jgi:hypothetical protein
MECRRPPVDPRTARRPSRNAMTRLDSRNGVLEVLAPGDRETLEPLRPGACAEAMNSDVVGTDRRHPGVLPREDIRDLQLPPVSVEHRRRKCDNQLEAAPIKPLCEPEDTMPRHLVP